jgi:CrcB protein
MSAWVWPALAVVGALGALLRYSIDAAISAGAGGGFPLGTLTINLTGSLVLGVITGLALYHGFPTTARLVLGTGACGAYTTFSTFSLESVLLARNGERAQAALNVGTNVVGSCLAAAAGLALAAI